jgi:hypothetical protein
LRVAEYPRVHTVQGLREEAERCFRLAAGAMDNRLREELLAYGRELLDRAERMEATQRALIDATREHNKVNSERS